MTTSKTENMRAWRSDPANREKYLLAHRCAEHARRRLASVHPAEYEELVNDERAKVGLPRLGVSRTGRPLGPGKRASA